MHKLKVYPNDDGTFTAFVQDFRHEPYKLLASHRARAEVLQELARAIDRIVEERRRLPLT